MLHFGVEFKKAHEGLLFCYEGGMYIMCLSKGLTAIQASIDEGILPNKTLGFIPTAGDPYEKPDFVEESRLRLKVLGLRLIELDVANEPAKKLKEKLNSVDGVYIAGGNTFFLLYQLQQKGLDVFIKDKVSSGLPYFGESAGAVLLASSIEPAKPIDDPDNAPKLKQYDGLGLIDFFPLPHIDREKYREVFERFMETNKDTLKIVRFRDDQAILTRDGSSFELLPSSITSVNVKA